MTFTQARLYLEQSLEAHEAYLLLEHLLGKSKHELLLSAQIVLSNQQELTLKDWLERRVRGEPLQHIVGCAYFYGLEFKVSEAVLIPRPETEVLVEQILADLKGLVEPVVLDVGTGSGAIALALKHECLKAHVSASDVSTNALAVAKENANALGLAVSFFYSDLLSGAEVRELASKADIIVANLPYLPEEDKSWVSKEVQRDPALALYSGEDGLDLFRRFEAQALAYMKPKAICWLELDPRNVPQAYDLCVAWAKRAVIKDLLGRDRFLRLVR